MTNDGPSDRLSIISEVAKLLRVVPEIVYRNARTIPGAFRLRSRWWFSAERLDLWMTTASAGASATKKTEHE
jgi:hypothetical protein